MWGPKGQITIEFAEGLKRELKRAWLTQLMKRKLRHAPTHEEQVKAYEALEALNRRRYAFPGRARYHLGCNLREAPYLAAAAGLLGLVVWSPMVGLAVGAAALFCNAFADLFLSSLPNRLQMIFIGGIIGGGVLAGTVGLIIGGISDTQTALDYSRPFALYGALGGPLLMSLLIYVMDNREPEDQADLKNNLPELC